MSRESLRSLFIYYLMTAVIILFYLVISRAWVPFGGLSLTLFRFELPLYGCLLTLLYFGKVKNGPLKFILVTLPFMVLFAGIDLFYSFLGRSPRPSDLQNAWSIFEFSPALGYGGLMIGALIPLALIGLVIMASRVYQPRALLVLVSVKVVILALIITVLGSSPFFSLQQQIFKYVHWSQKNTMHYNGRFSSFIYYYGKEQYNRGVLLAHSASELDIRAVLYPDKPQRLPNIHYIVLESWLDPTLLKGVSFNRPPMAEALADVMNGEGFSMGVSPAYGGGTAQAEFELLSGIEALGKVGSIEFNVMEGQPISGFVSQLKAQGYQTQGMIATNTGYYNSVAAYQSLGLDEVEFLADLDLKQPGDVELFDGDLLAHNLNRVKSKLDSEKPLFNYVLGLYGHHPYYRNDKLRPKVIDIKHGNRSVERIANQFYYRTLAIGQTIQALQQLDPDSIIYVTSDHLPPIINGKLEYQQDKYRNIALLFDGKNRVDIDDQRFYQIPWLIWDRLNESSTRKTVSSATMEQLYYKALNQSISQ